MNNDFDIKYRDVLVSWAAENGARVELIDSSKINETNISIKPANEKSCPIFIASRNGSTQIHIGKYIVFDEIDGLVATDGAVLSSILSELEFVALLNTVLAGNVYEEIKLAKGEMISSRGYIEFNGKKYCLRSRDLFSLFKVSDQTVSVIYEPN